MSLASSLKKAASKSLKALGGSVTIRKVTNGTYNTETGLMGASTSDTIVNGALSNVSNSEVNDLIQAKDKVWLFQQVIWIMCQHLKIVL
tara:strand:- start:684 stop:950 length:267 start_codon:yes stop_codon:yes gene_type:complete